MRYAVGHASLSDNDLVVHIIEAASEAEAMQRVLAIAGWPPATWSDDPETLKQEAFDADTLIGATKIED